MTKPFYVPDPYIIPTKEQFADAGKMMDFNKWISVKERLPELNVDVLIYVNFTVHSVTFKHCSVALFDGTCWDDDGWYSHNSVTHWMPLPKPPEEK